MNTQIAARTSYTHDVWWQRNLSLPERGWCFLMDWNNYWASRNCKLEAYVQHIWLLFFTLSCYQVYEGVAYKLSLTFPNGYPFTAPTVKFITPCFHPNVDTYGNICLDILKDKWSALYDVRTILLSIQSLLGDPNNDSPLNGQAAQLWSDQVAFKKLLLEKFQQSKS